MRIRTVKPEFWRSDDITRLPFVKDVRLLFIGLWSYVDDNGVGVDDYRQIAADLFALEEDPADVREFIREGLATLSRALLITRYEVDGRSYLFVTGWDRHQRVDRPNKPRYPRPAPNETPPTSDNTDEGTLLATPSRDPRETPATGTGEQGNRGTGEQGTETNPSGLSGGARAAPTRSKPKRGTRIPEDFAVTPEMLAWAREHTPLVGRAETDDFIDYWKSVPGAKGEKRDWVATWRRWMRKAQKDAENHQHARRPSTNGYQSPTDANIAAFLGHKTETDSQPTLYALPGGAE